MSNHDIDSDGSFRSLRDAVRGEVLLPGDANFDVARRVWNGMIDHHPAGIVRVASTDDVVAAVQHAASAGLRVTVRGGGHHVGGGAIGEGALVVDLSSLRGVEVDARTRMVRVQGGATLGDLDPATQAHGLAVPMGVVSETGVAGLTMGGGLGWLRRKYGLSIDSLRSAEVVTAAGEVVRASAEEHPDLFWGLRGGGGAFGVVTSFEFEAHPVGPEVAVTFTWYPIERATEVLTRFRTFSETAPEEISGFALLATVPSGEDFPEAAWGQQAAVFLLVGIGDLDAAEGAMAPLREMGEPIADLSMRAPFVEVQQLLDEDYPSGHCYYWKSTYIDALSNEAIEALVRDFVDVPSAATTIDVWNLGGAIDRVGTAETAFPHRGAPYLIGIESNWEDPAEAGPNIEWARRVARSMEPFSTGGSYGNLDADAAETPGGHGAAGEIAARLAEVKQAWDPTGMFQAYRGA